ncbi:hypothetical protein [Pedobacter sp. MC2016-24]|uniref:hypothetical protein n=1 Tax=Pedobacter sp. MC2016-24 TaxID=2780090 RepID=UPI001881988F|nr:hypothetical protein [Pedobacter sp. MC2016-24]MBE9597881.1 hypothetical protein [Pedobacter sp. MC2016-24]
MNTELHDIKTNIKIGEQIFEAVPSSLKPKWAGIILNKFNRYITEIPEIKELTEIIKKSDRWHEAHEQFGLIRRFLLDNTNYTPQEYILLAESIAKITYNSSREPAPFDFDSGYYVPSLALKAAEFFQDERLQEDIKTTLLLFSRNKNLKTDLSKAREILLYQQIDDILWYDWDPIGINDMAPSDEYQSYTPQIFGLVKSNTDRMFIAKTLFKIETYNMGLAGNIEKCLRIADKILAIDMEN